MVIFPILEMRALERKRISVSGGFREEDEGVGIVSGSFLSSRLAHLL